MEQLQDRQAYMATPIDERVHLFPGLSPSNSTYSKAPGCRCRLCTDAHRVATRDYLADRANGTWTDRRKIGRTRELFNDLAEMAMDYPPLAELLRRYDHEPLIIRVRPESVVDEPVPQERAEPTEGEHQEAAASLRELPAGPGDHDVGGDVTDGPVAAVPEPAEQVFSTTGPRGAEDVAAELLRAAMKIARHPGGKLPGCNWMLSAPEIASRYKVPERPTGQDVTRIVGDYIKIAGQGLALVNWPSKLGPVGGVMATNNNEAH